MTQLPPNPPESVPDRRMTAKLCSVRLWTRGGFGPVNCGHPAKVERGGKWYCTIHDPEYIARKDAERARLWARETELYNATRRVTEAERDVVQAVLAGAPIEAYRRALLDAIAARDRAASPEGSRNE